MKPESTDNQTTSPKLRQPHQYHELHNPPEIDEQIAAEVDALFLDENGQLQVTSTQLDLLDPRTRLVLFLDDDSGLRPIADRQIYWRLKREFWFCINSFIGGLTKKAFGHYWCPAVHTAAEHHRANFKIKRP